MNSAETGRFGEERARRFLESLGYTILERGYRSVYGEIDIIAKDGGTVVFTEVKTRRDSAFAEASAAVGRSKIQKLRKTAMMWFAEHGECPARFDVIEVYTGTALITALGETYRAAVRHIRDAF